MVALWCTYVDRNEFRIWVLGGMGYSHCEPSQEVNWEPLEYTEVSVLVSDVPDVSGVGSRYTRPGIMPRSQVVVA